MKIDNEWFWENLDAQEYHKQAAITDSDGFLVGLCAREHKRIISSSPMLLQTIKHIKGLAQECMKGMDGYEMINEWCDHAISRAEGQELSKDNTMTRVIPFSKRKVLWLEYKTSDGIRYAPSYELPNHIKVIACTGRRRMFPAGITEDEVKLAAWGMKK